jgi:hypothetical protein
VDCLHIAIEWPVGFRIIRDIDIDIKIIINNNINKMSFLKK